MIAIGRRTLLGAAVALGTSLLFAGAGAQNEAPKPGDKAPEFTLTDTSGTEHKLSEILAKDSTKAVVLEWFNADCPYVVRHYERDKTMTTLQQKYKDKGVVWLAVNTGSEGEQGRDRNHRAKGEWKIEYPILLDPTAETARAYGAKTTPHMFVITADGTLAYAGGIDNDSRGNMDADEKINYVEKALEAVLNNSTVETPTSRPYGCNVKY